MRVNRKIPWNLIDFKFKLERKRRAEPVNPAQSIAAMPVSYSKFVISSFMYLYAQYVDADGNFAAVKAIHGERERGGEEQRSKKSKCKALL